MGDGQISTLAGHPLIHCPHTDSDVGDATDHPLSWDVAQIGRIYCLAKQINLSGTIAYTDKIPEPDESVSENFDITINAIEVDSVISTARERICGVYLFNESGSDGDVGYDFQFFNTKASEGGANSAIFEDSGNFYPRMRLTLDHGVLFFDSFATGDNEVSATIDFTGDASISSTKSLKMYYDDSANYDGVSLSATVEITSWHTP